MVYDLENIFYYYKNKISSIKLNVPFLNKNFYLNRKDKNNISEETFDNFGDLLKRIEENYQKNVPLSARDIRLFFRYILYGKDVSLPLSKKYLEFVFKHTKKDFVAKVLLNLWNIDIDIEKSFFHEKKKIMDIILPLFKDKKYVSLFSKYCDPFFWVHVVETLKIYDVDSLRKFQTDFSLLKYSKLYLCIEVYIFYKYFSNDFDKFSYMLDKRVFFFERSNNYICLSYLSVCAIKFYFSKKLKKTDVIRNFGDPRLYHPSYSLLCSGMHWKFSEYFDKNIIDKFRIELNKTNSLVFFDIISKNDFKQDISRKNFWLDFLNKVENSFIIMPRRMKEYIKEFFNKEDSYDDLQFIIESGKFWNSDSDCASVFVLIFKDRVVLEFNRTSNPCFIVDKNFFMNEIYDHLHHFKNSDALKFFVKRYANNSQKVKKIIHYHKKWESLLRYMLQDV